MTRMWCLVRDRHAGRGLRPRARGRAARLEQAAGRRLRPRAGHAQPLQHAHPGRHPDLRDRRADDHRRSHDHPAAAGGRGPDARQQRRGAAQGRRDGRHLAPSARHQLARWHAAVVRGRQVHGRCHQRSVLQPGEHRRLRPHLFGRHTRSAHRGRPLPGGLRALRAAVHPRPVAEARPAGTRHRSGHGLQPRRRSAPVRIAWPSGRAASTSGWSGCPTTGAAPSSRRSSRSSSASSPTPTPASTS